MCIQLQIYDPCIAPSFHTTQNLNASAKKMVILKIKHAPVAKHANVENAFYLLNISSIQVLWCIVGWRILHHQPFVQG